MEGRIFEHDRKIYFEHVRRTAELAYSKNPLDAENLTSWGSALVELAAFQDQEAACSGLAEAESKLEEAVKLDPNKLDALWGLGNAYISHGFRTEDHETAKIYFAKATQSYQNAMNEDPANDLYKKAYELSIKAPALHLEFHRPRASQEAACSSSSSKVKVLNLDTRYEVLGWVILAVGIAVWVGLARSHASASPSG